MRLASRIFSWMFLGLFGTGILSGLSVGGYYWQMYEPISFYVICGVLGLLLMLYLAMIAFWVAHI